MAKLPFMKFYPSDFIVDTQTLNMEQIGCWIKLMCHIWIQSKTGTISLSNQEIAHLWGMEINDALEIFCLLWDKGIFENRRILPEDDLKDDANYVINTLTSRRISRDKKELKMNAFYVSKSRSKHLGKVYVKDKKSEVRSQKSETTTTTSPAGESAEKASPKLEQPKTETDLQKIVKGWKLLNSIPIEGLESKSWDQVHFARHARSAKSLLDLFGGWERASDAMEYVYMSLTGKKLTCTIETIVKHSDLYREYLAGRKF